MSEGDQQSLQGQRLSSSGLADAANGADPRVEGYNGEEEETERDRFDDDEDEDDQEDGEQQEEDGSGKYDEDEDVEDEDEDEDMESEQDDDSDDENLGPKEQHLKKGSTKFWYRMELEVLNRLRWLWGHHILGRKVANIRELGTILREFGFNPTFARLRAYMNVYSVDRKGEYIAFSSVCDLIRARMQDENIEVIKRELLKAFSIFDDTREGFIETSLIKDSLMALPLRGGDMRENLERDVSALIKIMDPNGERRVSYERFLTDLCKYYTLSLNQLKEEAKAEVPVFDHEYTKTIIEDLIKYQDMVRDNDVFEAALEKTRKSKSKKKGKAKGYNPAEYPFLQGPAIQAATGKAPETPKGEDKKKNKDKDKNENKDGDKDHEKGEGNFPDFAV